MKSVEQERRYPSGRLVKTTDPHSPWQKLVHNRMIELDLSLRTLASTVSTRSAPLGHVRLYNWIRHVDGYPPKDAYTAEINVRLARALDLKPERLARAYDDSRKVFESADPAPLAQQILRQLREAVASDERKALSKKAVLALIDDAERSLNDATVGHGSKE